MKQLLYLSTIIFLLSCSNKTVTSNEILGKEIIYPEKSNEIPPDGTYRSDVAFAEWEENSMDEKVTVVINGDFIKIIYDGEIKKGEIIDEGKIMKHKTGEWIIAQNSSDTLLDEIGGCTDGPAIIDFKNKKYWMC
ncbi:MAG: hypothetical protein LBE36_05705 [Flavobacteriaceae bacterium]|nr:hypothetical protein [Flavobacteriaceae bacterium]